MQSSTILLAIYIIHIASCPWLKATKRLLNRVDHREMDEYPLPLLGGGDSEIRVPFLLSNRGDIDRLSRLSRRLLGATLTDDVFLRLLGVALKDDVFRRLFRGGDLESLNDLARFRGGVGE